MCDLIVKENGEMTLLTEQFSIRGISRTSQDAQGVWRTVMDYHYFHDDIIAVNHNNSGEVTWKLKIDKKQYSLNHDEQYASFFSTTDGKNIFLIYNDTGPNVEERDIRPLFSGRDKKKKYTVAALICITDGGISKKISFSILKEKRENL
ncbi:MAG: hypothetical protein HRT57_09920 [Crocinitomicaceae bacterium]|nr:hypothetical protein [Crocinitomicaceae bacterium]